jgi:hypothetical protein
MNLIRQFLRFTANDSIRMTINYNEESPEMDTRGKAQSSQKTTGLDLSSLEPLREILLGKEEGPSPRIRDRR